MHPAVDSLLPFFIVCKLRVSTQICYFCYSRHYLGAYSPFCLFTLSVGRLSGWQSPCENVKSKDERVTWDMYTLGCN